ncbi:hypothetical protein EJ06DRAFT_452749, partial [Trichodelitschia bisporula]
LLLPLCALSTLYLYTYPLFHRCAFPSPSADNVAHAPWPWDPHPAPFRLLALADPQLEGDTSLPHPPEHTFPGLERAWEDVQAGHLEGVHEALGAGLADVRAEVLWRARYARKVMDLWGNDLYLRHVYRAMRGWMRPSHVVVLGDLLGSQWIGEGEFEDRAGRFWGKVFWGAERVPEGLLEEYKEGEGREAITEVLGERDWADLIICVAGNHDIGYAGDVDTARIERFEKAFGPVNGEIRFSLPPANTSNSTTAPPTLRLLVLNSMNLDTPALDPDLQSQTYAFLNSAITHSPPVEDKSSLTILLTHIPLHKEEGVCVDGPLFTFFPEGEGAGVREQNMLSPELSTGAVLQGLFGFSPDERAPMRGLGRNGLILTGHDHEGCDTYHYADREEETWRAGRWGEVKELVEQDTPGVREVTVRSMMGEFGGNAGLVSAWWDGDKGEWRVEVGMCGLGVQHVWWAVHIGWVVLVLVAVAAVAARGVE